MFQHEKNAEFHEKKGEKKKINDLASILLKILKNIVSVKWDTCRFSKQKTFEIQIILTGNYFLEDLRLIVPGFDSKPIHVNLFSPLFSAVIRVAAEEKS